LIDRAELFGKVNVKKENIDKLKHYMAPLKLMMRAFLHAYLVDSQNRPEKALFNTSERNIASHIRSSLEVFKNLHMQLLNHQVDTEYSRIGIKNVSEEMKRARVIPDIIVHLRGQRGKNIKDANYLCIGIKKIKGFNGDVEDIKNKKIRCD